MVSAASLSLQYVNSTNCIVRSCMRVYGGGWLYGWAYDPLYVKCELSVAICLHIYCYSNKSLPLPLRVSHIFSTSHLTCSSWLLRKKMNVLPSSLQSLSIHSPMTPILNDGCAHSVTNIQLLRQYIHEPLNVNLSLFISFDFFALGS